MLGELLPLVGVLGCSTVEFVLAVRVLNESAKGVILATSLLSNLVKVTVANRGRHQVLNRVEVVVLVRVEGQDRLASGEAPLASTASA